MATDIRLEASDAISRESLLQRILAVIIRLCSWPVMQAVLAALALAALTLAAQRLHARLALAFCWYMALVVTLSFSANAYVAIGGAAVAAACIGYFFAAPQYPVIDADRFDALSFALFVGVAVATATLVARLRNRTHDLQIANAKLAKHSETMLQQAQEGARVNRVMLIGEMTASIAHEINQPLTGILSNAGTSMRYLSLPEPDLDAARRYLEFTVRDGNRAAEVIRRVRGLARGAPPTKSFFDVNDAIIEALALVQGQLNRDRTRARLELSERLMQIIGDRIQLQQVVLNLILNASEAMDGIADHDRTLVVASGQLDADRVFIEVRDSGSGLRDQDVRALFVPFYTTKPEGMGMGLAISRLIVEAHGGELSAFANTPSGAVFRLTLPIRDPDL